MVRQSNHSEHLSTTYISNQVQFHPPTQQLYSQTSAQSPASNLDFIARRAKQVIENRQDLNFNFLGKTQFKEGYDLSRIVYPPINQLNEDFLCAIC
mmetsp:Transcript_23365/g.31299  ORF Transcript_23365/g.31299 Transcript_23365/m.31299 type:complete len:96 (-) Transcript_23365:1452-1739(-)